MVRCIAKITSNKFLFYSLVHKDIRKYIVGGGRAKLNKSDLLSIPLFIPCNDEQLKIVNFLDSVFIKIDLVKTEIEKTQEFKKGLLQQMFV